MSSFKGASQEWSEMSMYHIATHPYSLSKPFNIGAHVKGTIVMGKAGEPVFTTGKFGGVIPK